jgi:hypothetical protein
LYVLIFLTMCVTCHDQLILFRLTILIVLWEVQKLWSCYYAIFSIFLSYPAAKSNSSSTPNSPFPKTGKIMWFPHCQGTSFDLQNLF